MSAHTPGPLEVGYYRATPAFTAIVEHVAVMKAATRELIAVTGPSGQGTEKRNEAETFAKLFAAAPDLLAVCEALAGCLHCGEDGYWRIGPMADPREPDGKGGKVEMLRTAIAKARGGGE